MAIELGSAASPDTPAPTPASRGFSLLPSRVGVADRIAFTEQLALLLEAGVPLHTAIHELQRQSRKPAVSRILGEIHTDILDGRPLSRALAHQPAMFPATYTHLVAAAEEGGFLTEILDQLKDLDEKAQNLRVALVSALTYPAVLLSLSTVVVCFILLWVFPRFADLFESIHDRLPFTTLILMALSDFLRQYGGLVLAGLAAALLAGRRLLASAAPRAALERGLMALPGLGQTLMGIHMVRVFRILSLSLQHGVPLLKALTAAEEVASTAALRTGMQHMRVSVEEGRGLSAALAQLDFIPPLAQEMLATGERTGHLAKVLERLSEHYQRKLEHRLATLAKIVEPAMLLIMGALVAMIVSALILPIFKLSAAVH
ncbi:type II secretion system F family protein [Zoogloea sp.]|uniref:type II secretion system F family protein n=1 Tax=Zoogloea sp. TaxID=49181 RepID=UPI0035B30738